VVRVSPPLSASFGDGSRESRSQIRDFSTRAISNLLRTTHASGRASIDHPAPPDEISQRALFLPNRLGSATVLTGRIYTHFIFRSHYPKIQHAAEGTPYFQSIF
jgi:hypothetical protein